VELLCHFNGSNASTTFTDSSSNARTLSALGDAQISTTQSKFGGASGYFDGTGDAIQITSPPSSLISWASTPFTVECWVYGTDLASGGPSSNDWSPVVGNATPSDVAVYWAFGPRRDGDVAMYYWNGSVATRHSTATGLITENTWHHIAFTQSGGVVKIFVDGVEEASESVNGTPVVDTATPFAVGKAGNYPGWHGYIDDLRITSGVARTITLPTAAYPDA
jgi:hypothetical protein